MATDPAQELDPDVARLLAAAEPDFERDRLPIAEARAQMEAQCRFWNRDLPELARLEAVEVPGPAGAIRCRLLAPEDRPGLPVIVYFHGGGWTLGSLDSHDRLMRRLAQESGAALLAVDYRLAPEHPFPEPLQDCLAATRWVRTQGQMLGLDPERLVIGGDSAGANLALGLLLALRDAGDPLPAGAALFYGCFWARTDTPSHTAYGDGRFRLSTREMDWFWRNYLGPDGAGHPHAEPLLADLLGLPPLFLNVGSMDPLADDTAELARRLAAAGVPHEVKTYRGLVHGFLQMTLDVAQARTAMNDAGAAVRRMLDAA